MKTIKIRFGLLFASLQIVANAQAQKLPNIQSASVYAPANIKIDGNASEWNNLFLAFNHAAEIFYTVSNNAANLYLTVQSKDHAVIQKIVAGGITFSLKNMDKKSKATSVSITYPVMSSQYSQGVSYTLRTNDTLSAKELAALNSRLSDHVKVIPIIGVTEIPDSSVSVYNDKGIKAAAVIDHQKTYTIEMAIPLKYLKQVIDVGGTFNYMIQVNGLDTKGTAIVVGMDINNPQESPVDHNSSQFLFSPTYFKGSYTLAKEN